MANATKTCSKCKSDRILSLSAKCSDLCCAQYKGIERDGYVPLIPNIGAEGYGDYVEIDACMACGQLQGQFPVADATILKAMKG